MGWVGEFFQSILPNPIHMCQVGSLSCTNMFHPNKKLGFNQLFKDSFSINNYNSHKMPKLYIIFVYCQKKFPNNKINQVETLKIRAIR